VRRFWLTDTHRIIFSVGPLLAVPLGAFGGLVAKVVMWLGRLRRGDGVT
jgi:hypothetical protein